MAKTIYNGGFLVAGGGSTTIHTTAGRLLGFLISHAQATVQTVTFYDNTAASGTVILAVAVDPTQSPVHIRFERNAGIRFSNGLHVAQGNCHVSIWSVDHG